MPFEMFLYPHRFTSELRVKPSARQRSWTRSWIGKLSPVLPTNRARRATSREQCEHEKTSLRFMHRGGFSTTRFVADPAASPFGTPPCPGEQVGEGKALLSMLSNNDLGKPRTGMFSAVGSSGPPPYDGNSQDQCRCHIKRKLDALFLYPRRQIGPKHHCHPFINSTRSDLFVTRDKTCRGGFSFCDFASFGAILSTFSSRKKRPGRSRRPGLLPGGREAA